MVGRGAAAIVVAQPIDLAEVGGDEALEVQHHEQVVTAVRASALDHTREVVGGDHALDGAGRL